MVLPGRHATSLALPVLPARQKILEILCKPETKRAIRAKNFRDNQSFRDQGPARRRHRLANQAYRTPTACASLMTLWYHSVNVLKEDLVTERSPLDALEGGDLLDAGPAHAEDVTG